MDYIDVGKLKVSPFEFESILEIKINKELNEHATLYVCGIIKDDKQFSPATDNTEATSIKCENNGEVYFNGVLKSVKITCVNDVYRLEAHAISNTILLDTMKHKRSFQDNGQDYKSIVEKVIADNSGSVTFNADPLTVENIILQYDETDWEFAKRLASHTQDVLIPITADKPEFHFGVADEGSAELETNNLSVAKVFDLIRLFDSVVSVETEKNANPKQMVDGDVEVYTVETDEVVCDLGEILTLNGAPLHICKVVLHFVNSALTFEYTLCQKKVISTPKFYNRAITGLILDGKVLEIENDTVKLKLDDDTERGVEEDTDEAHFFKYATGYSAEGHTGWYVMPEEDDIVQLVFPNEDEKYAYATSSVRQEDIDKTSDPSIKFWRSTFGDKGSDKEIKMGEKEILITSKDDETFIQIHEEDGIHIKTPHPISIIGDATITIVSKDDMTIQCGKKMVVSAEDSIEISSGGSSIILQASGIDIVGTVIKEN